MSLINNLTNFLGFNNNPTSPQGNSNSFMGGGSPSVLNTNITPPIQPSPINHTVHSFIAPPSNTPINNTTPPTYYNGQVTDYGRSIGLGGQQNNNFNLDTSNITSNHLGTDNTPQSVLGSLPQNPYAGALGLYQQQAPNAQAYANATFMSPEQMSANQNVLQQEQIGRQIQQNYLGGVSNVMGRPEAMDFQQGQEAQLTRQNELAGGQQALNTQASTAQANYLEQIRQNNIAGIQAQQTGAQNQFQNSFNALQGGLNYGISAGQLAQGRYEYQQITDPNTGFPTIMVIDKQTGLPSGNIAPGSSQGQQLIQSGMITNQNPSGGNNGYGQQVVNSTLGMIGQGIQPQAPLSQIVQQFGLQNVVQAIVGQEGGSPKGVMNNPGNIKFDPQHPFPGATNSGVQATDGGMFASFPTPQAGLQAVGNIVTNAMNGQSQAYGQNPTIGDFIAKYKGVSNQMNGGQSSPTNYQNVASQAPVQLQSAIKPLPDGSAYIDSSLLARPEFGVMAQNFASQHGIKVLNSADASAMNTLNQSIANMQTLSQTFGDLASKSAVGGKLSNLTDPLSQFFDTNFGSQLKSYISNREGLFQQIRALAGSSPRLNGQELNMASNSMPTLNEFSKDTLKDGINKLVKTQSYLDNAIRAFIPNYVGTPVQINGQYAVLGSNGKSYTFPDNNSALSFLRALRH